MNYSIIATLGPASAAPALWADMLSAGATAFRLNTAHLSMPQLHEWLERLAPVLTIEPYPPLILDLQGSKWRIGDLGACELATGQLVTLEYGTVTERPAVLPVPHLDFFAAAPLSNGEIILNDAKIVLRIETIAADTIHATVVQGGPLRARKGVTYTVCDYRREDLTAQDRAVYELTHAMEGVRYAISYGRDAHELARYRASLGPVYLIAKVERPTAIVQAAALAKVADELWLCRGDLGAEMGLPAMAQAAHHFSAAVNTIPKPVLLAGQVLEHLAEHWLPTRAEVCALYAALQQGYSGLVLSDETAVGCQPAASCRYAAMFRD